MMIRLWKSLPMIGDRAAAGFSCSTDNVALQGEGLWRFSVKSGGF